MYNNLFFNNSMSAFLTVNMIDTKRPMRDGCKELGRYENCRGTK